MASNEAYFEMNEYDGEAHILSLHIEFLLLFHEINKQKLSSWHDVIYLELL